MIFHQINFKQKAKFLKQLNLYLAISEREDGGLFINHTCLSELIKDVCMRRQLQILNEKRDAIKTMLRKGRYLFKSKDAINQLKCDPNSDHIIGEIKIDPEDQYLPLNKDLIDCLTFTSHDSFYSFVILLDIDYEEHKMLFREYDAICQKMETDLRYVVDSLNFGFDPAKPNLGMLENIVNGSGPRGYRIYNDDGLGVDLLIEEYEGQGSNELVRDTVTFLIADSYEKIKYK